jgi:hypothetical protein
MHWKFGKFLCLKMIYSHELCVEIPLFGGGLSWGRKWEKQHCVLNINPESPLYLSHPGFHWVVKMHNKKVITEKPSTRTSNPL